MPVQLFTFQAGSTGVRRACEDAAELYNTGQFRGPDGLIDPTDLRYQRGGVHMGRDGSWYLAALELPGSYLVVAYDGDQQVGHSLFFTGDFPPFAADVEWMKEMDGVKHLAYGYLTIVRESHRGGSVSGELVKTREDILVKEGVTILGTEVFVLPQTNLSSLDLHRRIGAVCVGGIGTHKIPEEVGRGTVYYAQFATATPGNEVVLTGHGTFRVDRVNN